MAQKKKQLIQEGKLDKHGRPNEATPKEYLRALPDVKAEAASAAPEAAAGPATDATTEAATENGEAEPTSEKKKKKVGFYHR